MSYAATVPNPAKKALVVLGSNIALARRRRKISSELMAKRCFVARSTLVRLEKGDPSVGIGVYATALFMLGMESQISNVASPQGDSLGCILGVEGVAQRVRDKGPRLCNRPKPKTCIDWCKTAADKAELSPEYVLGLWHSQNGKCAITGLVLRPEATGMFYPSLDRIDSEFGYIEGNVHIVLLAINYMKNSYSLEETKELVTAMRWNKP